MLRKSSLTDSLYKQGSSSYLPPQRQRAGCSCLLGGTRRALVLCTETRCVLQYKPLSCALQIPETSTLRGAWCQHTGLGFERISLLKSLLGTSGDWSCATPKLTGNGGREVAHPGSVSQSWSHVASVSVALPAGRAQGQLWGCSTARCGMLLHLQPIFMQCSYLFGSLTL